VSSGPVIGVAVGIGDDRCEGRVQSSLVKSVYVPQDSCGYEWMGEADDEVPVEGQDSGRDPHTQRPLGVGHAAGRAKHAQGGGASDGE
jgi:hypothetical protein